MLLESKFPGCSRVLLIMVMFLAAYMLGSSALVVDELRISGRQSIAAETRGSWEESGMQGLCAIPR
jgi:hypothetical protein